MKWGFSDQQQQLSDLPQLYVEAATLKPQYWRLMAAWNIVCKAKDPAVLNARDWTTIDRSINDVLLTGAQVIMIIGQGRPWKNATAAEYASFCTEVATRYKPGGVGIRTDAQYALNAGKGVVCFEIWNEQNNAGFWGLNVNPTSYVAYLKAAYTAIKAVTGLSGTNSTVLFGGLQHVERVGPWYGAGWMTMPEVTFVSKCYDVEPALGSYYDAMTEHIYTQEDDTAYTSGSVKGPAPAANTDNLLQLVAIRDLMVDKGDGAKKIWITEAGFSTAGLSEANQSTYLQALFTFLAGLSYVEVVLIYNIRDTSTKTNDFQSNWGVMKFDYTKKAAWSWLTTYAQTAGGSTPMSASDTVVGLETTSCDLLVKVRANLTVGQRMTASTSVGTVGSAGLVNLTDDLGAATTVGMSTTAGVVVNGMTATLTVDITTTADVGVLTLSGSTLVGINT